MRSALGLAWRIALCAAAGWIAWRLLGAVGLAVTAPLAGVLFARPLLDLGGAAWRGTHSLAYRRIEGRHYAYRGSPVRVHEDAAHRRWVRAADVRTIVATGASDAALRLTYGESFGPVGDSGDPHIEAEALLEHLRREPQPAAHRFARWVERDIAFPARRQRERLGIRPTADADPRMEGEGQRGRAAPDGAERR